MQGSEKPPGFEGNKQEDKKSSSGGGGGQPAQIATGFRQWNLIPASTRMSADRRIFWTTRPEACGELHAVRRRLLRFQDWSTRTNRSDPERAGQRRYRTIKTDEWLHGLILNILNTRARTDVQCPIAGGRLWPLVGVLSRRRFVHRFDAVECGGKVLRPDRRCGEGDQPLAVRSDMGKLIAQGIATTVEVEATYRGTNSVEVIVTVITADRTQQAQSVRQLRFRDLGLALNDAMTCTIARPDPQALFDHLQNMFSSTVLGGGKVIPESNEWYVVTNDYAMAEQFYAIADQMWRETNPETACCENLYKMAAQHGVFPRPPSHADGYAKLTGIPARPCRRRWRSRPAPALTFRSAPCR